MELRTYRDDAERVVQLWIPGAPAPKGSKRARGIFKGGTFQKAVTIDVSNDKVKAWGTAVREAAIGVANDIVEQDGKETRAPVFLGHILSMEAVFLLQRPKAHYHNDQVTLRANAPAFHGTVPDLGKLLRATEDPLIGLVIDDDCRIADYAGSRKIYAASAGDTGAIVIVRSIGRVLLKGKKPK